MREALALVSIIALVVVPLALLHRPGRRTPFHKLNGHITIKVPMNVDPYRIEVIVTPTDAMESQPYYIQLGQDFNVENRADD